MVVLPCTQINLPEMTWTWTLQAVYRNVQLIVFCVHCTHAAPYFLSKGFEIMYGDGEVEYKYSLYTDKLDKWWTEHMSRRNLYTRSFTCTSFLTGSIRYGKHRRVPCGRHDTMRMLHRPQWSSAIYLTKKCLQSHEVRSLLMWRAHHRRKLLRVLHSA